jgi:hypothetical protein
MTENRDQTPNRYPQGDDQTQPSKSPGEIEGSDATQTSQGTPGETDRTSDEDETGTDDEDLPQRDPENVG